MPRSVRGCAAGPVAVVSATLSLPFRGRSIAQSAASVARGPRVTGPQCWRMVENVICEAAMTRVSRYRSARAKLAAGWRDRALSLKAVAFGLVGVVNTVVDYG